MASGLECLPTEEKKFFQIGVKKGERSFLRKPILKLKKRVEFISVRKNGSSKKSRFFIINFQYVPNSENLLGITVSKKIGKAVTRNYLKRIVRSIIRNNINLIPKGILFEVIPKKGAEKSSYHLLERDLVGTLTTLKI